MRFGLYAPSKNFYCGLAGIKEGTDPGLLVKIASGATSGGIGSGIATPTDVVKIRFQKEGGRLCPKTGLYTTGLYVGQAPMYKSTLAAFASIYRTGGLWGLYVGWQPTMVRAACLAGAQLSGYDHSKHLLKTNGIMEEGARLHLTASVSAAVVTTIVTQPPGEWQRVPMSGLQ